jgi:hypothetical protein
MALRGAVELVHGGGRPTSMRVYDDGLLLVDGKPIRAALGLGGWGIARLRRGDRLRVDDAAG